MSREIVLTPRIRFVIESPPKGRKRFRLKLVKGGHNAKERLDPDDPYSMAWLRYVQNGGVPASEADRIILENGQNGTGLKPESPSDDRTK